MLSPVTFIQQTREELQKVTWPTRDGVIRLTSIVIIISAIVALYISGLDLLFTRIIETIVK